MHRHNGELDLLRRFGIVFMIGFFSMMSGAYGQEIFFQMEKASAEEFCGGLLPTDTTRFTYCVTGLVAGIDKETLEAVTLTEMSPELYPALADALIHPERRPSAAVASGEYTDAPSGTFVRATPFFTRSCDALLTSAYVIDIGFKDSEDDEGALQIGCSLSHEGGFYGGGWISQSTRHPGRDTTFANEADWFVGFARLVHGMLIDLGVLYYDIVTPKIFDGGAGDFIDYTVKLSRAEGKVRPLFEYHIWRETGPNSFPGGWYVKSGLWFDGHVRTMPVGFALTATHNKGTAGIDSDVVIVSVTPLFAHDRFALPISYMQVLHGQEELDDVFWMGVKTRF